jgi:hypothetical protein
MANRKDGTRPDKQGRLPERAEKPVFLLVQEAFPGYLSMENQEKR